MQRASQYSTYRSKFADITYKGLCEAGVGPDINTIYEDIHVCTPDGDSNMLKAWGKI